MLCCCLCSCKCQGRNLHNRLHSRVTGCVALKEILHSHVVACVAASVKVEVYTTGYTVVQQVVQVFNRLSENLLTAYKRSFWLRKHRGTWGKDREHSEGHSWRRRNPKTPIFQRIEDQNQGPIIKSSRICILFSFLHRMNSISVFFSLFSVIFEILMG